MTGSRSLEPSPAQESETGASGGSGKAFPSRPFIAIAQVINDFVTGLQRTVHDDDLWAVRARLKQGAMIDHDRDAVAFSCAFLTANYWKAAHALMAVRPDPVRRIVDLGSGSGAMALATLAYLWQLDDAAPQRVHLRLVDRSRQQLMIAQQVLEQVRRELKGLDVEVSLEPHDVRDLGPSLQHDRADLVTASHLFTENREHVGWLAERAVESVAASGTLIMIEPHDDAVWSNLLQYVRGSALPSQNGHAVITPGRWMTEEPTDPRPWKLRWLALQQPAYHFLPGLVRAYFSCWRSGSKEGLDKVFLPEAEYCFDPFQKPLKGLDQVKQYWEDHVLPQRHRDIRVRHVDYQGRYASVEWTACFLRGRLWYELQGMMVVEADPERERLVSLREYYRTRKTPA